MLVALPAFDHWMVNPPDSECPRLCCFFFFKGDSTRLDHVQAFGWGVPCLQAAYYNMDKEYSRKISRLAIPQLLNEINILKDPQQAERRFKSVVMMDPGILSRPSLTAAAEAGDEEEPSNHHLPNTEEEGSSAS